MASLATAATITKTDFFGNFLLDEWNTSNQQENVEFTITTEKSNLTLRLPKHSEVISVLMNISTGDDLINMTINISGQGEIYS